MSNILKGLGPELNEQNVIVPGYGTIPLEQLKRHVKALSADFNQFIQQDEFTKAAYYSEQFFNALLSLARAIKKQEQTIDEGDAPPKVLFNPKPKQKGPDDYEYTEFVPRGEEDKTSWAIQRTINKQKLKPKKQKELDTGFYKNYLGNRPFREEQAPMFTPEETLEEQSNIKEKALRVMYDAVMNELRKSPLNPSTEQEFKEIVPHTLTHMFSKRYPNLTRQQLRPATQAMANDMFDYFFRHELQQFKPKSYPIASGSDVRESSILEGLKQI